MIGEGLGSLDVHFQASPEGRAGLMVPRVDDATAHMFPFRGRLVRAGGLFDVDREFLFGPVMRKSALVLKQQERKSRKLQDAEGRT